MQDGSMQQSTNDTDVSVKQQIALNLGLIYKALLADAALDLVPVPATATSAGTPGQVAASSGFFYLCIANDTWRRVAIVAF